MAKWIYSSFFTTLSHAYDATVWINLFCSRLKWWRFVFIVCQNSNHTGPIQCSRTSPQTQTLRWHQYNYQILLVFIVNSSWVRMTRSRCWIAHWCRSMCSMPPCIGYRLCCFAIVNVLSERCMIVCGDGESKKKESKHDVRFDATFQCRVNTVEIDSIHMKQWKANVEV